MTTPSAQELREAAYICNKEVAEKLFPIPEQFLERKNFREGFMHGYLARAERAAAEQEQIAPYVQHKPTCPKGTLLPQLEYICRCTCGLDAILATREYVKRVEQCEKA